MKANRLLQIGKLIEADTGRDSITKINRIVKDVKKEMAKRIADDAEKFVMDHLNDILSSKKKDLVKAGDPSGEMVEDMIVVTIVGDALKSFRKGLSSFHGLSDKR